MKSTLGLRYTAASAKRIMHKMPQVYRLLRMEDDVG